MFCAIDAGNTNIVFALFEGKNMLAKWRIKTTKGRTADEYQSFCLPLLQEIGLTWGAVEGVLISSVIPAENFNLEQFTTRFIGKEPIFLKDHRLDTGLDILLPHPEQLGGDRVANAVGAKATYKTPCLIIDFGTGTTFEVLNKDGAYMGGLIAPGVHLSLEALHRVSAKLPNIDVKKPKSVMGTDTVGAMQSGIYYGYLSMIDGMVKRIEDEQKINFKHVIATGGLAPLFQQESKVITDLDHDLTLRGLYLIYDRNRKLWK